MATATVKTVKQVEVVLSWDEATALRTILGNSYSLKDTGLGDVYNVLVDSDVPHDYNISLAVSKTTEPAF